MASANTVQEGLILHHAHCDDVRRL